MEIVNMKTGKRYNLDGTPIAEKAAHKISTKKSSADFFLKLPNVEGESKDDKHKGEIEIVTFDLSAVQAGTGAHGGGSGAGKAVIDDMTFTMAINKAVPRLFLACVTGEHFPEATFIARKAGGSQQEYLTIKLTNVLITQFNLADHGQSDPIPVCVVSLNFSEIDMDYKTQKADGALGGAVKVGYNLSTNKKK